MDRWARFLACERLSPDRADPMTLVRLAEELARRGTPRYSPYADRQRCRRLVAEAAIDLGIDLAGMRYRGRLAMARSLLDAWNAVYAARFGSFYGTAGWREAKRRDAKMARGRVRGEQHGCCTLPVR